MINSSTYLTFLTKSSFKIIYISGFMYIHPWKILGKRSFVKHENAAKIAENAPFSKKIILYFYPLDSEVIFLP